ncbi:hypothetical protein SKAU_G00425430 [Synaphobranchus kaupii]|uniref:Uncharacterized protein n=1 Tax=Synaphobranchus kaupii TaxID=118154 RepID=A0A9Q1E5T2_SYNKA|nr:hypothetical protein SKAU_G00425430 [Synaphobranchus kaupii]
MSVADPAREGEDTGERVVRELERLAEEVGKKSVEMEMEEGKMVPQQEERAGGSGEGKKEPKRIKRLLKVDWAAKMDLEDPLDEDSGSDFLFPKKKAKVGGKREQESDSEMSEGEGSRKSKMERKGGKEEAELIEEVAEGAEEAEEQKEGVQESRKGGEMSVADPAREGEDTGERVVRELERLAEEVGKKSVEMEMEEGKMVPQQEERAGGSGEGKKEPKRIKRLLKVDWAAKMDLEDPLDEDSGSDFLFPKKKAKVGGKREQESDSEMSEGEGSRVSLEWDNESPMEENNFGEVSFSQGLNNEGNVSGGGGFGRAV